MNLPVVAERYRILDRIGQGGMGVVYRVEDLVEHEVRALKIMPRTAGRANLRGEFLALARLRHDNVVRVFDYGRTEQGDDFFTMELVVGKPLRAELAPPPTDPAFWKLVGGVLRALAFIHARGMVHADIKPSNVLVDTALLATDPARAAKLLDFGLAAGADDPARAAARGTFPYAAPEVYAGRVDARSDLYALGVLLYELTTGTTPFPGVDAADVIRRQRQSAPADPRTIKPELSAEIAELILSLTDPEPGARLQTADEVLGRINQIAGTDFTVATDVPPGDLNGALVGRDRDLAALQALWESATAGTGSVALVGGEEGIGKSRLLAELKLRIQLAGGRFYSASAIPRPDSPFGGLAEILRAMVIDLGDRQATAARDRDRDRGASAAARRAVLAPLLGEHATPELSEASRYALAEALTAHILDASRIEPVAIALDDLHTADRGTLELFTYLARAASGGRLLLIGAGRSGEGPLTTLGQALANVQGVERYDLPPLDRSAVRALVGGIYGAEFADAMGAELHRVSGGNPAFLERTLAALVEMGALGRRRGAWILLVRNPTIPIAPDAVAAAHARAAVLPLAARRVIDTAAVLGEQFDYDLLTKVVGNLTPAEVSDALGVAINARILGPEAEGEMLIFTHPGLRPLLYGSIPAEDRARLHRAAVAALTARMSAGARVPAAALAEHYLVLEDHARAIKTTLAAGDDRLAAGDHHGALSWYERATPLIAAEGRLANAAHTERLGDVRSATGDVATGCDDYRRAHDDFAGEPSAQIRVTRKLAELLRQRGQGDEAIDRLMRALAQARASRSTGDEAWCHYSIARVRMWRSEYAAAVEHASAGLALARSVGNRGLAALLGKARADVELFRGDAKTALAHIETALAEVGNAGEAIMADLHATRGRAGIHSGDYPRAIESMERALAIFQRLGKVEQEARILANLGGAWFYQGAWDRAQSSWERFLALCDRMDDAQEVGLALNNLGHLYSDRGDFAAALAALDRARDVAQRCGRMHIVGLSIGNRGEVLYRQSNHDDARACYETALAMFEKMGAREDTIEIRRRLCELDLAAGRVDAALDRAIDVTREAAQAGAKLEEAALHRIAANALRLQGDLDSAVWFLERAREIATTLGAAYDIAKIDLEAGELAAARGRAGDAETHLARAADTFANLGARWDLARARDRRRELGQTPKADPGHLSQSGLEVLLDVARASGRMELEKLLEIVLDKILEVTRFERGFILLLDERGRPTERMRRTREGAEFDRAQSDFSGSVVRRVAQTGESVAIIDIADDAALREQVSVIALGLRSVLCAPIRLKGRVNGIVYVDSRRLADEDRASDLALLEALASQAAIAIENARLVGEEQRKTELMAILAHEIRNPLAGILGFSELIPEELAEMPAKYVQLMGRIHNDAQRLKRLVDNMLELARVEAGKVSWEMAPVALGDLLADLRSAFEAVAGKKRIELVVNLPDDLPPALGNADRLFQVLSNLLGNALKFTPEGGKIILGARVELVAPLPDRIAAATDDFDAWLPLTGGAAPRAFVRVDVRDSGPGIPPAQRIALFEKFAQGDGGKRAAHGVGLGLYISREIVRRHGGTIWVESEPGHGACFCFRIPTPA